MKLKKPNQKRQQSQTNTIRSNSENHKFYIFLCFIILNLQTYQGLQFLQRKLICPTPMDIGSDTLQIIAIVYSAIALAVSLLAWIVLETPTKSLIYLQLAYLLSKSGTLFSSSLEVASGNITLPTESYSFYCGISNFICQIPLPVTLLIFAFGILLIFRLITIAEAVRMKGLNYHRVHRWLKGLIRWMIMIVVFFSIIAISASQTSSIIPAAVLLAACVIFPVIQLILYWKFPQTKSKDIHKWLQFFDYVRIWLFALCVALAQIFSTLVPSFFLIVIIMLYSFLYAFTYPFKYQILGRILHITGEAMIIIDVAMTVSGSSQMSEFYLDLFFLGIIVFCDLIFVIMECVHYYRNRSSSDAEVVPEHSEDQNQRRGRYEAALADLNESNENFNDKIRNSSSNEDLSRSGVYKSRSKPLKKK